MDADGRNARPLTHRIGIDEYPVWSPDGKSVGFTCTNGVILRQRVGDFEVCVMAADGSGVRRVTDAPGISIAYSWSPDGGRIAFDSSRDSNPHGVSSAGDLYTMRPDGSNVRRVTTSARIEGQPAWSCEGFRFAYITIGKGGNTDIHLMSITGKRLRRLTFNAGEDADPAWRP